MFVKTLFCFLGIFHYFCTINLTQSYSTTFTIEQKLMYFSIKVLSFIIIMIFWNSIPNLINKIKEKNENFISYTKHFLFYFILNIVILALTNPFVLTGHDFIYIYEKLLNYNVSWFQHIIPCYLSTIAYNILPFKYGIAICAIFMYSCIFSYIVNSIKNNISKKYYYLIYLYFCFLPIILINLIQERLITCAWFFALVTLICFFNQNKKYNNIYYAIGYGLLSSYLVSLRSEYISLILFIPLLVFFMKIFTKKNFLIYLIVFLLTFSSVQIIQKKHFGFVYEIHNLCFVYDTCVNYNLDCKKLEEIIPLIQTSEYTGCLTEHIDTSNNELNKRVLSLFSQTLLEHHKFIITKNIKFFEYKPNNKDFLGINMKENPIISEGLLSDIGVKLPDSNFTYDIISKLAYFSDNYFCNNYLKVFYNFYIQYLLLVFVLIYGLLKKQNFFILQFFIHNTILLTALLTMPFYRYFYTYTFSFNTWILFFIILISILGKQKKE